MRERARSIEPERQKTFGHHRARSVRNEASARTSRRSRVRSGRLMPLWLKFGETAAFGRYGAEPPEDGERGVVGMSTMNRPSRLGYDPSGRVQPGPIDS